MLKITSNITAEPEQKQWPRIERAEIINGGQHIAVLVREFDGTISAVRIPVEQLAD